MATNLGFVVAELSQSPVGASLEPSTESAKSPSKPLSHDQIAFDLFGGLHAVADASLSHMMKKLDVIQKRWPRVADILQVVVDIHQEKRAPILGGASISKALDVLLGYGALPRRARLSQDWSDFRDVSHLIAAAAAVSFAGRKHTKNQHTTALLAPVLFVPEVVIGLGLAFQEFGLTFKPYRQRTSILPSKTLWRIPKTKEFPLLPLMVRQLSADDLKYLTKVRRARPKA